MDKKYISIVNNLMTHNTAQCPTSGCETKCSSFLVVISDGVLNGVLNQKSAAHLYKVVKAEDDIVNSPDRSTSVA